ncbi:alpha/beta family hydrolase [Marinicellulosiphila megalodicopiae]|uniref:alpha/beta family hydrolase n=1 Tax=Marinicellulosiphila megalodicopiae TaxID=2724896 RepID=UPI003BB0FF58
MSTPSLLTLTHGAGASIESLFLQSLIQSLKLNAFDVNAFNFDYMETILKTKKRRPPEKMDKLKLQFANNIKQGTTCIAGKSMGGRVATMLAADREFDYLNIKHVFVWGYPFFAPKKDTPRIQHFDNIQAQVHIFQGTRDCFGKPEQIDPLKLPSNIHIHWIDGADHDFKILKCLNRSTQQTIDHITKKMRDILEEATILN